MQSISGKNVKVLAATLIFLTISLAAEARTYPTFGPISVRTQNPIYLQNLSLTPSKAEPVPFGALEVRVDSAYSNLYEYETNSNYLLDMDMELWRLALRADYGISDNMEVGVEIPFYHFWGGFLDGFISEFHKLFGFPNAGRENVANNRFEYRFADGNGDILHFPSARFGLGDISIHVKNQIAGEDSDWPDLSWFAELKFPTGKSSRGYGSGHPDFGFGALLTSSYKRLHGHFNAGYYVLGGNDSIENQMRNTMFAYSVAGELTLLDTWALVVQLYGSTPLLQGTGLDKLDGVPLDLIVGFRGEETNVFKGTDLTWQFGFSEDVTSRGPSVDFTVFASIGFRFDVLNRHKPVGEWLAKSDNQGHVASSK